MSNLSELLPAGAGAKSADFVASGTLGSGVTVALKADGTVTAVASVAQGAGSPVVFEAGITLDVSSAYDSTNNKIVIGYRDDSAGGYGTAVVGTVSGTSISFGTPVQYISAQTDFTSIVFDSSASKIVVFYRDSGTLGKAKVGTVSGTSISFGAEATFNNANTQYIGSTYDSTNNKPIVVYRDGGNSGYGTACVGTVSGTSISFGPEYVFSAANVPQQISATFDSNLGKVVIVYRNEGNSNYGTAIVGTVSGTLITFGSAVVFNSSATSFLSGTFDSNENKIVVAYRDEGNADYGTAIVGTVSGTSISFGSEVVFESASSTNYISATFDSSSNKVVIAYSDSSNLSYGTTVVGEVSGTSISFGSPVVFESATTAYVSSTFDSNENKVVIAYRDSGNSSYGTAIVFQTASSNNTDFIGITDQAIADTATGAVIVQGGVSDKAIGPYSLSAGSEFVFETSDSRYIDSVYDPVNQKIIIAYWDVGNSYRGTAVVGTVSGTSISFGTPVVFDSVNAAYNSIIYDSVNEKVVIAFAGASNYGTAIVGTVSGTTISFGTPTVFESATTSLISAAYDTNAQKILIAYKDQGNLNYGTAIAGTVSGTSISFGSANVFESANIDYTSTTYDSNAQKTVIAYRDVNNSGYGTARVATIGSTSIGFGTVVVFNSGSTNYIASAYDINAQKHFIAYQDGSNSSYGTAVVGTVSGTSISFGSESVFEPSTMSFSDINCSYDPVAKKILTFYKYGDSPYSLKGITGTINGTDVSFDEAIDVYNNQVRYISSAYDPDQNKTAVFYRDNSNSSYGTSSIASLTSSLTPNTDYYVQTDGTLSTTVSSVPAGRALSSTSILLEG